MRNALNQLLVNVSEFELYFPIGGQGNNAGV